jgi:hypothetical protein
MRPSVDNKEPTRFNHLRSKNYKEEFFKKREVQIENNLLVSKILQNQVSLF